MSSLSMLGVLANQHKGTPASDCITTRLAELKRAEGEKLAALKAEQDRKRAEDEKKRVEAVEPLQPGREFSSASRSISVTSMLRRYEHAARAIDEVGRLIEGWADYRLHAASPWAVSRSHVPVAPHGERNATFL